MASIEDVVNVIVALGARPITQTGFETPLFISAHELWEERFRIYTSSTGAITDGFDPSSPVVKALNAFFNQTFAPSSVVVGRRDFGSWTIDVTVVPTLGDVYSFDIVHRTSEVNTRSTVSFTATASETTTDLLATELAALVTTATSATVTGVAVANQITLTAAGLTIISIVDSPSTGTLIGQSTLEDMGVAVVAIDTAYKDYFFVTSDSDVDADILLLAAFAESNKKLYGYSKYDVDIFDSGSTADIANTLKLLGYQNTFGIALTTMAARSELAECAAIGSMASVTPGASVLHGKTLSGVTAGTYTDTQSAVAKSKYINIYPFIAGGGFLMDGYVASGSYFDNTRGILWLEARMEENIFLLVTNKSNLGQKIPGDDSGIAIVTASMSQVLDVAVRNGLLIDYRIQAPTRAQIPPADLQNRIIPDIPFTATLAGAFQYITIRGYVSI